MMSRTLKLVAGALLAAAVAGCGTSVTRMGASEVTDLSGDWNDTDSRLVSEEMIQDALSRAWLESSTRQLKRPPVVIVGEVRNLSHEHINTNTFVSDLERALINSGRVEFVASRGERGGVREERKDMDTHAREETRKAMGQEFGADFMLSGTINTIYDVEGRTQIRFYQIDLTLISMVDNRKVWIGQKKIKKEVKRASVRL